MYVCICHSVTDRQIREAARQGCQSLDALRRRLKVAARCGRCESCAVEVLAACVDQPAVPAGMAPAVQEAKRA